MLPDQAAVAELTLASTDWLTSIEGRAGAAKTTTVGAIREFAEEQGYAVYGFAPTTRAVKALCRGRRLRQNRRQPPRRTNRRTASETDLDRRRIEPASHPAGQPPSPQGGEEGVERIIFVGDQRQHHAIEAGRPMYQMQEAGMLVARLDTIRRQRDPELREAVMHAARGEIAESLAILTAAATSAKSRDIEQRRKQIAREYVAAHESGSAFWSSAPQTTSAAS